MTIEIVDFPIKNGGSFHSYVKLPEGIPYIPKNAPLTSSVWSQAFGGSGNRLGESTEMTEVKPTRGVVVGHNPRWQRLISRRVIVIEYLWDLYGSMMIYGT